MDSKNTLFLLSCTHHSVSIEIRENLVLSIEETESLYAFFREHQSMGEFLVLSTCNRTEFYVYGEKAVAVSALFSRLAQMKSVAVASLETAFVLSDGEAVINHLFSVCAGIDSQMIGETEILGQVKAAYEYAHGHHATGTFLNIIFQKSFHEAKWARSNTNISTGQISIGNIAVELSMRIFGELKDSKILLIGSGEVGEKTARAFINRGAQDLTVSSRRFCSAVSLAKSFTAAILDFSLLAEKLKSFDIVVCATSAPHFVLDHATVNQAVKGRAERPLFLIDLAVPRDIEPSVETLENVYLYNLTDIASIANENLSVRQSAVDTCRKEFCIRARTLWEKLSASR